METGVNTPISRLREPEFFPECWKTILKDVVAFVDVRTGSDNRSKSVATEMEKMGAEVVGNFSKRVTHVVFKDGSKPIYDKAKAAGIPVVSYLWVVACKDNGQKVATEGHEAINSQDYDSPYFKWRKIKSMQPKELEEELKMAERRIERRKKKIRQSLLITAQESNKELTLPYTPITERKSIIDTLIESSPLVQERIQQELASGKTCDDIFTVSETEGDDFDTFLDTPLMLKIISKNYYSPRDPPPSSIRKILSEVRQSSLATATTPSLSGLSRNEETSSRKMPSDEKNRVSLPGSPLAQSNTVQNGSNKRKTRSSMSSVAKKRKENDEDIAEKLPRRKLLFQPKRIAQLPQEPLVALTPEESPKKSKKKHPCFSQVSVNLKSQVIQAETCVKRSSPKNKSPRRDSLADFRTETSRKRTILATSTIVCTSLHSESLSMVEKAVEQLQEFQLIETVNDTTTHVVCGDSRRTLNVMRGVVRGVRIVSFNWVTDSVAKGSWLNEDDYKVERFSAAASLFRTKKKRLFGDYESIYVSNKSPIPPRDLCDMIRCAGGELTNVSKKASVIVGQWKPQANVPCVTGTWILDCIEKGLTLPLTDYLITSV